MVVVRDKELSPRRCYVRADEYLTSDISGTVTSLCLLLLCGMYDWALVHRSQSVASERGYSTLSVL